MTKKKHRRNHKIDIVTFLVIVLGFVIVIYGFSYIKLGELESNASLISKAETNSNGEKVEEVDLPITNLDVTDSLVNELYNRVVSSDLKNRYWMYGDYSDKDLIIKNVSEPIKMNFVGYNLAKSGIIGTPVVCDANIPDVYLNAKSVCSLNKAGNNTIAPVGYKREDIENIYKNLYGDDSVIDYTQPLYISSNITEVYYYVEALDMYVNYFNAQNILADTNYTSVITKATRDQKEIKIYEDVMNGLNGIKSKYVYTFEIENNKYVFVSRIKESA